MPRIGRLLSLLLNGYTLMGLLGTAGAFTFWHDIRHQPLWVQILWLLAVLVALGLIYKHRKLIFEAFKRGNAGTSTTTNIGPRFISAENSSVQASGNQMIVGQLDEDITGFVSSVTSQQLREQTMSLVNDICQHVAEHPNNEHTAQGQPELALIFGGRIKFVLREFHGLGMITTTEQLRLDWQTGSNHWITQLAASLEALALRL